MNDDENLISILPKEQQKAYMKKHKIMYSEKDLNAPKKTVNFFFKILFLQIKWVFLVIQYIIEVVLSKILKIAIFILITYLFTRKKIDIDTILSFFKNIVKKFHEF